MRARRSLASDAKYVVGGRIAGVAGTALVAFLLPRCLTPEDCGKFLVAQNMLGLGALVAGAGLPLAILRILGEGLARRDREWTWAALTRSLVVLAASSCVVTAGMLLWLISGGGAWLHLDMRWSWLLAFAAGLMLLAWQWVLVEAIRGLGELRFASLFAGGQSGGPFAAIVFAATLLMTYQAWPISALQTQLLYAAALLLTLPGVLVGLRVAWRGAALGEAAKLRESSQSSPSVSSLLAVCLPICATQLLAFLTLAADLPIAGVFCPPGEVALLGQARRLLLVLQLPGQAAVMTILASAARLHAEGKTGELQGLVRRATTIGALCILPPALLLLAAPGDVLAVFFGEFYRGGASLLVALSLGQLVAVYNGMAGYVLIVSGRQHSVVLVNGLTAALMLTVGPVAAAFGGVLGLAIAASAILALQNTLEWLLARRLLQVSTHFDWRSLAKLWRRAVNA